MNPAFAQMLAAAGLGAHALGYVALAVTLCSGLDALLLQPAAGSHWLVPRKVLSFVALNLGNATNGKQPAFASWLLRVALPLIQAQQAAASGGGGGVSAGAGTMAPGSTVSVTVGGSAGTAAPPGPPEPDAPASPPVVAAPAA